MVLEALWSQRDGSKLTEHPSWLGAEQRGRPHLQLFLRFHGSLWTYFSSEHVLLVMNLEVMLLARIWILGSKGKPPIKVHRSDIGLGPKAGTNVRKVIWNSAWHSRNKLEMSIAAWGKHLFSRVNVTAPAFHDPVSFKQLSKGRKCILEVAFIPNSYLCLTTKPFNPPAHCNKQNREHTFPSL